MIILDETDELCLSYLYEDVQLLDKDSNQILFTDNFYGDPSCGLIDTDNRYSIVGGKHLTLWTCYDGGSEVTKFETRGFSNIENLRSIDRDTIEVLIDPWSEYGAIWQLTISNKSLSKICSFLEYKNKPYTDDISW